MILCTGWPLRGWIHSSVCSPLPEPLLPPLAFASPQAARAVAATARASGTARYRRERRIESSEGCKWWGVTESVGFRAPTQEVDGDGDDHDHADRNGLPVRVEADHDQPALHDLEEQDAQERA